MKINPKISVITVCYNSVEEIERTILSVVNQTYKNIEYIVIDGGSMDGTLDVIKKYLDKIACFITEPDDGIYDAMNKGIKRSTGEWVNFMNAGDVFADKEVLNSIFNNNQLFSGYDVIYGKSLSTHAGKMKYINTNPNPKAILHYPIYRHGASFTKANVHKNNLFDLSRKDLKYALDYNHIFLLYNSGYKFKYVDRDVMIFELDGTSNNPFENRLLTYKITSQKGSNVLALFWLVYSCFTLVVKKVLNL